jgi:hypothetical protein
MSERPSNTLPGTVEKIVKSTVPSKPDKAHIAVEGAGDEQSRCLRPSRKEDRR